jgi:uncharacterized protein with beta-barrel porin domain
LNLTVDQENVDVALGKVGLRVHSIMDGVGRGRLVPELRGGVHYDFAGDEAEATSTFSGGGAAFTTTGAEVEQLAGTLGVGVAWESALINVSAAYDGVAKSGYFSHTATLEAKVGF